MEMNFDTPPERQAFDIFFRCSEPALVEMFIPNPRPAIDGRFACNTSLLFTSKPGDAESNALIVFIKAEAELSRRAGRLRPSIAPSRGPTGSRCHLRGSISVHLDLEERGRT